MEKALDFSKFTKVVLKEPMDERIEYGTFNSVSEAKERFFISEKNDTFIADGNTLFIYLID